MVKKISHIVLSFLLLISTAGFAVSKHYCQEFLISTSLFSESDACCEDGNCCHNETAFYQVDEDFTSSGFSQLPHVIDIDLFINWFGSFLTLNIEKNFALPMIERDLPPPPNIQKVLSLKQAYLL